MWKAGLLVIVAAALAVWVYERVHFQRRAEEDHAVRLEAAKRKAGERARVERQRVDAIKLYVASLFAEKDTIAGPKALFLEKTPSPAEVSNQIGSPDVTSSDEHGRRVWVYMTRGENDSVRLLYELTFTGTNDAAPGVGRLTLVGSDSGCTASEKTSSCLK